MAGSICNERRHTGDQPKMGAAYGVRCVNEGGLNEAEGRLNEALSGL